MDEPLPKHRGGTLKLPARRTGQFREELLRQVKKLLERDGVIGVEVNVDGIRKRQTSVGQVRRFISRYPRATVAVRAISRKELTRSADRAS